MYREKEWLPTYVEERQKENPQTLVFLGALDASKQRCGSQLACDRASAGCMSTQVSWLLRSIRHAVRATPLKSLWPQLTDSNLCPISEHTGEPRRSSPSLSLRASSESLD